MKSMKRLLAMLLCVVMVVGLIPASIMNVFAVSDTIYVLAGGDFQEAGDHANSANNVTNILAQIGQQYDTMDGFLFIGDYDCETHDNATETANGITALMGAVQGTYSNLNDANSVLVQGNHDYMDSRIDATGGHDFDGYSAYVLNEDDYPNYGGSQSQIQTLANNLENWLSIKVAESYDAPIFVVSHLPLAFTPRTATQGDAKYAKYIFDVLNAAGEEGLNIIFLHGHDHAYGPDNYIGGEAVYLAEGDTICIAEAGSQSLWTEETLNFTYMNAGYTGYYSDAFTYETTAGTEKLTMTVFAITGSEVTVERYSENGLYNMKSAGEDGSYSNTDVSASKLGLPFNYTVYPSPQTIALTTSSTAEEAGTIGSYVEVAAGEITDDVTTSGGDWTEIIAPVPGTPAVDPYSYYQYTRDDDGLDNGADYLIVGSGTGKAMGAGTLSAVDVTLSESDTKINMDTQATNEWTIDANGRITNGTQYLVFSGNTESSGGTLSTTTSANDATTWTVRDNGSGNYSIYVSHSYTTNAGCPNESTTTQYCFLYYNNSSGNFTIGTSNTESNTSYTVRLYGGGVQVDVPGSAAIPDVNGLYAKLVGELTYEVTPGTSADEALAAVKAGIDGYRYEAMSTPGSNVTGTVVDDSALTWEWVDTFDGSTPGDYAIRISYNGVELGVAEVVVPTQRTYYIAEGKGLYAVAMNTTAANALEYVKEGVSVYSATDANGSNKTLVDDANVTWTWVDTYDGTNNGPYTVDISIDGVSLGTVEVKVDVRYESGLADGWQEAGTVSGGYRYVLDTDGIDYYNSSDSTTQYIIVAADQAYAVNGSGGAAAITLSSDGSTATTTTRDYEYHFIRTSYNNTRYELITKDATGSQYLYQEASALHYGTRSSVKFQINHHGSGVYDIHDIDGTNWYIIYSGGWTVTETTSARVRLYRYDGEIIGGTQYVKLEGNTLYGVPVGTSATAAMNVVKEGITAYLSSSADGSNPEILDDSKLTWKWKNTYNGQTTGSYFVEISYNGISLGVVEVVVEPGVVNNYPEYPKEGAVKVNKTATGIDFQASGVAQVEISASGVPTRKGADVIVMLDTSSSMAYCLNCNDTRHSSYACDQGGQTRAQALEESLANLIAQFKQNGEDGELLDIRVAIADFNGFYDGAGEPYDRDAADTMSDDISYSATSQAQIYTSTTGDLDYTAFVNAQDLATTYELNYTSGTNYDYAFDAIYQMGASVQAQNEINGEERDLFVIFMSDGAGMQWNYYHSQGNSSLWNEWITGQYTLNNTVYNYTDLETVENRLLSGDTVDSTAHSYYFNLQDTDGDGILNEHRMANAIKGDPSERYEVIRKTTDGISDIQEGSNTNLYTVPGLGATLFSIAFDPRVDTNVTIESMVQSIETLASEQTGTTQHFYNVDSAEDLASAFTAIGSEVAYAANNARFVDQMGENFNLQLGNLSYLPTGVNDESQMETITPYIEILSYDIRTRADYENGDITEDQIGVRKGTSTLLELVAFNADGTAAYSNLIDVDGDGVMGLSNVTKNTDGTYTFTIDEGDNIMSADQVIYARTFYYNANTQAVALEGVVIPTGINSDGTTSKATTNLLPSETFYWKMGTVQTLELAMRYFVYLEGALEGTMPAGSYGTNEFATLYYDNYLGNTCYMDTVSPTMGWKEANVSYAFYLVNEQGQIIVNQATGATGTFANKVAVTNPVVYDTIMLNNEENLRVLEVAAISDDVLPKYYTLYDEAAVYHVDVNSNSTGSWEITKGTDKVASTYVTNHTLGTAYSNALTESSTQYDYTHTVVWFAVVWSIEAHPDAIVVDYGLPVDIDVLSNDMFGDAGKVNSVSATIPWQTNDDGSMYYDKYGKQQVISGYDTTVREGFGPSCSTTFGTATVDTATNKITYQMSKSKGMQMNTIDQFAYAVQYTGTENAGYYYYDAVTIIPATTIYYEESFLTFSGSGTSWSDDGSAVTGVKQDEDRPGAYSLSDANNIYGYDSVNDGMSAFSLGTAKKVHVGTGTYATASFSFIGTGFDVVSMTSSDTGVIAVQVVNAAGTTVEAKVVNTYYGAQYNEETDAWEIVADGAADAPNQIWQVPVLQVEGLDYGSYTVTITATYAAALDKTAADGYDLYLDAIRIYDPAGTEYGTDDTADGITGNLIHSEIQSAYTADGERWPVYYELRNMILAANSFDDVAADGLAEDTPGIVFIDGDTSVGDGQIADYVSYGPNNELYLLPGQRVAFVLTDTTGSIDNVHLGLRSANGTTATYTITNIAAADIANSTVQAGDYYNARTYKVDTTTDMQYDLTTWKDDIIVISNTGNRYSTDGVLALTNIKITHTAQPSEEPAVRMTRSAAMLTLRSLNAAEPVEDTIGDTNVPEQSTPETEAPEQNAPETGDTVTGETTAPETGSTGNTGSTGSSETEAPEDTEQNTPTEDTPVEEAPEETPEETPEEDVPTEDGSAEDETTEQLGFWARLWNAIKNAFKQLLSWLGF